MDSWQFPSYLLEEFDGKKTRYCVCIFVLNEGQRLLTQLARMREYMRDVDVIVVDGGSVDGATASAVLKNLGVRCLLIKTGPGNLSAQMRLGFAYALQQGYAGVIVMDGHNKDDPSAIPGFVRSLDEGYDHIQGSRFLPGGAAINTPWERWVGIRFIHTPLISLAAWFPYTDTTNGFRAYSRRLLADPRVAPLRDIFMTYELHYYLSVRAPRLGFRVKELPVRRVYPGTGPVPTKIKSVRAHLHVVKKLIQACTGYFNPPVPTYDYHA